MVGATTEEPGDGRSYEGVLGGKQQQRFQYGEALAEWRSLEQVENGSPSTSPRYWDIDDDDDDDSNKGPKPGDLYGKFTWKIDKFSQINKREVRSNAFEIGGYKWYILIYPQGCDVRNHLSLFLCVAHHDKLLPGWSHFAQFTIAVVNKDHKKSKYSDTLHKFCKKEHDWGWKKFMELSKALDGFIEDDTLIIKAQVQVIRVREDRPFRCLDSQYRRELVRVYLTNVEQICHRFAEERRGKLRTFIEDKARWSSIRAFWMGMDHSSRCHMSHEKTDSILKVIVKQFFIEKEVTSTLVMDSLYSGLKALEGQNKEKKSMGKCLEEEEFPLSVVQVQKGTFALVDDVLQLLERAVIEPLPPKDDKGRQNRTKDGSAGEVFNKDSFEHDEKRLTELGCRTIEIFVLSLIFSKVEVKYREDVALKMQEELIREEEAFLLAELERKARRGQIDKQKKSKKKQKQNNRKGKDKGRDGKNIFTLQDKIEEESHSERTELAAEPENILEKSEAVEYASDESDSVDCAPEILPSDSEDRNLSLVNWDTDTSDAHPRIEAGSSRITGLSSVQNGIERSQSVVDESSSTCSSDSVPSVVVVSVVDKGKSYYHKNQKSPSRETTHQTKLISESVDWVNEEPCQPVSDAKRSNDASQSSNTVRSHSQSQASIQSLQVKVVHGVEQQVGKKECKTGSNHRNLNGEVAVQPLIIVSKPYSDIPNTQAVDNSSGPLSSSAGSADKSKSVDPHNFTASKPTEKPVHIGSKKLDKSSVPYVPVMSRPVSAPLVPGPRPAASMVSMVQMVPVLGRSVSAAGQLGLEPTTAYVNQSYVPQSAYSQNHSSSSMVNASLHSYSHAPPPFGSERANHNPTKRDISFGMVSQSEIMDNGPVWNNAVQRNYDLYNPVYIRPQDPIPSSRQSHVMPDEFPHLDIINDLLDDEHSVGMVTMMNSGSHSFGNNLNRHYSFPGDPFMSGRLGPSGRFDRSQSYNVDGIQDGYGGGLGRNYDTVRDITPPQVGPRPYLNGQIDGFVPNQWQMSGSDVLHLSSRNFDGGDGYSSYRIPDYTDSTTAGINGYITRPSN